MPVPTSYDEDQLALYMHAILGEDDTAKELEWTVAGLDYDEAVVETLFAMGVDSLATVTGRDAIRKLRVLARVELWRLVAQRTAGRFNQSMTNVGGASYSKAQVHEHAKAMLVQAESEAVALGYSLNYSLGMVGVTYANDPYDFGASSGNEWSRLS